jgi:ABC-type glutathione transport system ATPase component
MQTVTGIHEAISHEGQPQHHHHAHAASSQHGGGHHLLQVEDLSIGFTMYEGKRTGRRFSPIIEGLNISVHNGEMVALVGASGSGKTLLADAIMGLFEPNATVTGTIWFDGVQQSAAGLAALRGKPNGIALVPQSITSLDPLMRINKQLDNHATSHLKFPSSGGVASPKAMTGWSRAATTPNGTLLTRYNLAPAVTRLYPHQLSGGMARRVLLLTALTSQPRLLIADEPTPGLDPALAHTALEDLRAFADEGGGVLLITHDIELALQYAHRIAIFKEGTVVEETSSTAFNQNQLQNPYSRALHRALHDDFQSCHPALSTCHPALDAGSSHAVQETGEMAVGSSQDELPALLTTNNLTFAYPNQKPVLQNINIRIQPGERLALTAPSGTGKTTLCKLLAGYLPPTSGSICHPAINAQPIAPNSPPLEGWIAPKAQDGVVSCGRDSKRHPAQLIAQHPELMVDPRLRLGKTLAQAGTPNPQLLKDLDIDPAWLDRYPHELSGGELQRICIARALAANPRIIIADEISTMLDAITQARIWNVLLRYLDANNAALVFVSHSPTLTNQIATRTLNL